MAENNTAPTAVRYPSGAPAEDIPAAFYPNGDYEQMGVRADYSPDDTPSAVILTYGHTVAEAQKAKALLSEQGISVGILLIEQLTPYIVTAEKILALLPAHTPAFFLEEGVYHGGAGMHLLAEMVKTNPALAENFHLLAIQNPFETPKTPTDLREFHHISAKDLAQAIASKISQ